jgi:hypothetical protein
MEINEIVATRLDELVAEVEATDATYDRLCKNGVFRMVHNVYPVYGSAASNMRKKTVLFTRMLADVVDRGSVSLDDNSNPELNGPLGFREMKVHNVADFYNENVAMVLRKPRMWHPQGPAVGDDITEGPFSFLAMLGYKPVGSVNLVYGQTNTTGHFTTSPNAMRFAGFRHFKSQEHYQRYLDKKLRRKRAREDAGAAAGGAVGGQ